MRIRAKCKLVSSIAHLFNKQQSVIQLVWTWMLLYAFDHAVTVNFLAFIQCCALLECLV